VSMFLPSPTAPNDLMLKISRGKVGGAADAKLLPATRAEPAAPMAPTFRKSRLIERFFISIPIACEF